MKTGFPVEGDFGARRVFGFAESAGGGLAAGLPASLVLAASAAAAAVVSSAVDAVVAALGSDVVAVGSSRLLSVPPAMAADAPLGAPVPSVARPLLAVGAPVRE